MKSPAVHYSDVRKRDTGYGSTIELLHDSVLHSYLRRRPQDTSTHSSSGVDYLLYDQFTFLWLSDTNRMPTFLVPVSSEGFDRISIVPRNFRVRCTERDITVSVSLLHNLIHNNLNMSNFKGKLMESFICLYNIMPGKIWMEILADDKALGLVTEGSRQTK